ncbi:hypothetical protein HK096_003978, partial [Nowakowskiella sp. JEL0078]
MAVPFLFFSRKWAASPLLVISRISLLASSLISHPAGSKLWFPNFVFRLVRSNLPPHQAMFKVPPQLTKVDIKAYLKDVYKVSVTDVRTMNYLPQPSTGPFKKRVAGYKKAVVSLTSDFIFPPQPPESAVYLPGPHEKKIKFKEQRAQKRLGKVEEDRRDEISEIAKRAEVV